MNGTQLPGSDFQRQDKQVEHGDNESDAVEDPDTDTLDNLREQEFGTHPFEADYDSDNLTTRIEQAYGTDPLAADTDADGLPTPTR